MNNHTNTTTSAIIVLAFIIIAIAFTTYWVMSVYGQETRPLWTWVKGENNTILTVPLEEGKLVCNENKLCSNTNNITKIQELSKLPDNLKGNMTAENYGIIKDMMLLGPYHDTMQVTLDAANQTEGVMIDQYIAGIKNATS